MNKRYQPQELQSNYHNQLNWLLASLTRLSQEKKLGLGCAKLSKVKANYLIAMTIKCDLLLFQFSCLLI